MIDRVLVQESGNLKTTSSTFVALQNYYDKIFKAFSTGPPHFVPQFRFLTSPLTLIYQFSETYVILLFDGHWKPFIRYFNPELVSQ